MMAAGTVKPMSIAFLVFFPEILHNSILLQSTGIEKIEVAQLFPLCSRLLLPLESSWLSSSPFFFSLWPWLFFTLDECRQWTSSRFLYCSSASFDHKDQCYFFSFLLESFIVLVDIPDSSLCLAHETLFKTNTLMLPVCLFSTLLANTKKNRQEDIRRCPIWGWNSYLCDWWTSLRMKLFILRSLKRFLYPDWSLKDDFLQADQSSRSSILWKRQFLPSSWNRFTLGITSQKRKATRSLWSSLTHCTQSIEPKQHRPPPPLQSPSRSLRCVSSEWT